jgi:hypothetical protein
MHQEMRRAARVLEWSSCRRTSAAAAQSAATRRAARRYEYGLPPALLSQTQFMLVPRRPSPRAPSACRLSECPFADHIKAFVLHILLCQFHTTHPEHELRLDLYVYARNARGGRGRRIHALQGLRYLLSHDPARRCPWSARRELALGPLARSPLRPRRKAAGGVGRRARTRSRIQVSARGASHAPPGARTC